MLNKKPLKPLNALRSGPANSKIPPKLSAANVKRKYKTERSDLRKKKNSSMNARLPSIQKKKRYGPRLKR